MKRGKKYAASALKVQKAKLYSVDDAVKLVKETASTKFDSSVDALIKLNLKDKQKKESVKGTVTFPNQIGKVAVVAVIAELSDQKEAEKAGADFVGMEEIVKKIEGGWTDFDVLIATPEVMPKIAKLGKYIGKSGLMPNPKNETVTKDIEKAVKSYKAGKVAYKMYDGGVFQIRFAKASMTEDQIKENLKVVVNNIKDETKKFGEGVLKSINISSSMGPAIKIDPTTFA